ncbi:hypothetical protein PSTG_00710 [Puccinia striiformis f. sp. tritici PST-78]|uniref:Uncharacterized protein n=1 Tax=Puccinia striiformis f. sp. tritici PST-78 TaxID=1165861 RepID=A0A0L0W400_9BASI|nr:hypothetical protein PSTG_00710 [Puccinia striiformis f. sp. tritici PST-78]
MPSRSNGVAVSTTVCRRLGGAGRGSSLGRFSFARACLRTHTRHSIWASIDVRGRTDANRYPVLGVKVRQMTPIDAKNGHQLAVCLVCVDWRLVACGVKLVSNWTSIWRRTRAPV